MEGGMGPGMIFSALQAGATVAQGDAARSAGKFQARVAEANAQQSIRDGEAEAGSIRDAVRRARGEQMAAQGSGGFEVNTGSALTALRESLIAGELDIAEARRQARSRAASYRAGGAIAKAEGQNRFVGSLFGAAGALAGAARDWASMPAEYGYRGGGK